MKQLANTLLLPQNLVAYNYTRVARPVQTHMYGNGTRQENYGSAERVGPRLIKRRGLQAATLIPPMVIRLGDCLQVLHEEERNLPQPTLVKSSTRGVSAKPNIATNFIKRYAACREMTFFGEGSAITPGVGAFTCGCLRTDRRRRQQVAGGKANACQPATSGNFASSAGRSFNVVLGRSLTSVCCSPQRPPFQISREKPENSVSLVGEGKRRKKKT